jgi:hypothetical protein
MRSPITPTVAACVLALASPGTAPGRGMPEPSVTPPASAPATSVSVTPGVLDAQPLKPGQYAWNPERSPHGPVVVVVSIPEQRAHVYRNGIEIGVTTVSTGRAGHPTPTGVFTILQKQVKHESTIYDGAPMPYMERLTWDGIAIHAGSLPGYPVSHGCVHVPLAFARLLYGITTDGGTVVIADAKSPEPDAAYPGPLLSPDGSRSADGAKFQWQPETSPEGPISMVLSGRDRRLYVYRNGLPIGWADVQLVPPNVPLASWVYTVLEGRSDQPNPWVPGQSLPRWQAIPLDERQGGSADLASRVRVDPDFAAEIFPLIVPGTTLFVTDEAAAPATRTGPGFTVLSGEPAPKAGPVAR